MEPKWNSTVDGGLVSRVNMLRFIREFVRGSQIKPGYYMEFGVLNGSSMVEVYGILRGYLTHLYGFDSFKGLPELTSEDEQGSELFPLFYQGNYASLSKESVEDMVIASTSGLTPDQVTMVEGDFSDSLKKFDLSTLKDKGPCIAAHLDCDLYSSSKDVFEFLDEIVESGTWLLMDDYWTYKGSPHFGQRKAIDEWVASSKRIGLSEYGNYGGYCKAFIAYEK